MNERDKEIVYKRFELNYTLKQIGDEYGITRERVRQLLNRATGLESTKTIIPTVAQYRRFFRACAIVAKFTHNQRHGTVRRYVLGCRCADCRYAEAERMYKARHARRGKPIPDYVIHGTATTYAYWSCRCPACTEANTIKCREYNIRTGRMKP